MENSDTSGILSDTAVFQRLVLTSWRFTWVTHKTDFSWVPSSLQWSRWGWMGLPVMNFSDICSVMWKNSGTVIKPMRSHCAPYMKSFLPGGNSTLHVTISDYQRPKVIWPLAPQPVPLQCLNNWKMDRQATWDKFPNKVNGGSVKATGYNATSYYHVPDLKKRVVSLSPTLSKP